MNNGNGKKRSDFKKKQAKKIDRLFKKSIKTSWKLAVTIDDRLSKSNFVTNGSGAVATLAFIGSGGDQLLVIWSLGLFTIGVVAHVFELRFYKRLLLAIHKDCVDINKSWRNDEPDVQHLYPEAGKVAKPSDIIGQASSWVSQVAFVLGVLVLGYKFGWPTI